MTRKSALKCTLSLVISIAAAFFFGYAAHLFAGHYSDFELQTRSLRIANLGITEARSQRRRVEKYNLTMDKFAKFSSQVEYFGLGPDKWCTYDVNLKKILPLAEAANIIAQLAPGEDYYFQPLTLLVGTGNYIKTVSQPPTPSDPDMPPPPTPSDPDMPPTGQPDQSSLDQKIHVGDVLLEVQGKFIVRDKK